MAKGRTQSQRSTGDATFARLFKCSRSRIPQAFSCSVERCSYFISCLGNTVSWALFAGVSIQTRNVTACTHTVPFRWLCPKRWGQGVHLHLCDCWLHCTNQQFCSTNPPLQGYNLLRDPKTQLHSTYRVFPVKSKPSDGVEATPLALLSCLWSPALEKGLATSPPLLKCWCFEELKYSLSG